MAAKGRWTDMTIPKERTRRLRARLRLARFALARLNPDRRFLLIALFLLFLSPAL